MDGRHFFRQAVKELYDNPFPARAGPRVSASRAAKQARHEREQKKKGVQLSETETVATTSSVNGKEATSASSTATPTTTPSLPGRFVEHCILNLPATALEFLDGFQELYTPSVNGSQEDRKIFLEQLAEYSKSRNTETWDGQYRFPMVHCYCFTKEVEEYEKDICEVRAFIIARLL
jgi:tRNA (guanine37-N1)-methyltransferase